MFEKVKNWFHSTHFSLLNRHESQSGVLPSPESAVLQSRSIQPAQIIAASACSTGKQRGHNEDSLFSLSSILVEGNQEIPFGLFMVADGMGGHQFGEVASGSALRAMAEYLLSRLMPFLLERQPQQPDDSLLEMMNLAVQTAQKAVLNDAPGGGTTLTAALIMGNQVTLAHVGDSRANFISSQGELKILTEDHSMVNRLVQLGHISEKEAEVHSHRNILYRALGQNEGLVPDMARLVFPRGGYLLLCTDGLWGVVSGERVARIVSSNLNLSDKCQTLIDAANDRGGPDNITVVLVQYLE